MIQILRFTAGIIVFLALLIKHERITCQSNDFIWLRVYQNFLETWQFFIWIFFFFSVNRLPFKCIFFSKGSHGAGGRWVISREIQQLKYCAAALAAVILKMKALFIYFSHPQHQFHPGCCAERHMHLKNYMFKLIRSKGNVNPSS